MLDKKSESGRSMLEIIGVMGIMGLITAGAFVLIRSGRETQRRSAINDTVSSIVTGIRTLYADYDDLSSLDGTKALSALSISTTGPNGVTYSVEKVTGNNKQFQVEITNLSDDDCTVLEAKAWSGSVDGASCSSTTLTIKYNK